MMVAAVMMMVGREMFQLPGNFNLLLIIYAPWCGNMKYKWIENYNFWYFTVATTINFIYFRAVMERIPPATPPLALVQSAFVSYVEVYPIQGPRHKW